MRYLVTMLLAWMVGCAPTPRSRPGGDDDGMHDAAPVGPGDGPFDDFPADPIIEAGAPANAPDLFTPTGATSGGPCIAEPEPGTLYPRDWLRPRFSVQPGAMNLFEIRLHADNQIHDLVVYTASPSWTMPLATWGVLNAHTVDQLVTVTVRGATYANGALTSPPAAGAPSSFRIAPVAASGTIAYWTATDNSSFKGFKVGEETVHLILQPSQVGTMCVGCHSSTPDGKFVAFSSSPSGDGGASHVDLRTLDGTAATPSFASPTALQLLGRPQQQQPIFSPAHWSDGDRIALSMFDMWDLGGGVEIIWTDLGTGSTSEGVGWGRIARTGDSHLAGAAAFSHDGQWIAYTSSGDVSSGVNIGGGSGGDLYLVPYNNHQGGNAMPIPGASDPSVTEHYAAFSPDDRLLAFTRGPVAQQTYDDPMAEVYVIPRAGGTPVRLAANDPGACSTAHSPGVTNSWPKWAPESGTEGTTRYYWLTFSSRRGESGTPQLYVTGVTVDEVGNLQTYPAIYLWNQPADEGNHTPAWDNFDIVVQ